MDAIQEELVNWISPRKKLTATTSTAIGTAMSESSQGSVDVLFDASVLSDDGDTYSDKTTVTTLPTTVYCREGDKVIISLYGADGLKHLTVTGVVGGEDALEQRIEDLESGGGGGSCNCNKLTIADREFASSDMTAANYPCCYDIGEYAFYNCLHLDVALFPSCVRVGDYAFQMCTSLTTAVFPSCTAIGEYAFNRTDALTTGIFNVLKNVPQDAFLSSSLKSIVAPHCVTIEESGMRYSGIEVASFPLVDQIGDYAFNGASLLTTIIFPAATHVGNCAFWNCAELVNVSLPSATWIGQQGISQCPKLRRLELPSVMTFRTNALAMNSLLEELNLYGPDRTQIPTFGTGMLNGTSITSSNGYIYINDNLVSAMTGDPDWGRYQIRGISQHP